MHRARAPTQRLISRSSGSVILSCAGAFCASLGLASVTMSYFGSGERGTAIALQITARCSFILFWFAYSGSALAALFGAHLHTLKRLARDFGLAFASAHIVHIGLVAWLCYINEAPPLSSFVFFGVAVFWTYALVVFSIDRFQRAVGHIVWRLLSLVGVNYIMLAFAVDFFRAPFSHDAKYLLFYLPFIVLCIIGLLLRLAAWAQWTYQTWGNEA